MRPSERYQVRHDLTTRRWGIVDRQTGLALISHIETRKQADEIRGCLCLAYWTGADAVKTGEVIL